MKTKIDIRRYSDNELSLIVFNDETYYRCRHNKLFIEAISEDFLFTDAQLEVLIQDLQDDLENT